jgi:hypothetical protein
MQILHLGPPLPSHIQSPRPGFPAPGGGVRPAGTGFPAPGGGNSYSRVGNRIPRPWAENPTPGRTSPPKAGNPAPRPDPTAESEKSRPRAQQALSTPGHPRNRPKMTLPRAIYGPGCPKPAPTILGAESWAKAVACPRDAQFVLDSKPQPQSLKGSAPQTPRAATTQTPVYFGRTSPPDPTQTFLDDRST